MSRGGWNEAGTGWGLRGGAQGRDGDGALAFQHATVFPPHRERTWSALNSCSLSAAAARKVVYQEVLGRKSSRNILTVAASSSLPLAAIPGSAPCAALVRADAEEGDGKDADGEGDDTLVLMLSTTVLALIRSIPPLVPSPPPPPLLPL